MLRCVGLISRASGEISTRPLGAGPAHPTPDGQCIGRHVLQYALRFDADELQDVALLRASQDFRRPFLVVPSHVQFEPPFGLEGEVVFSCLKGAEDGRGLIMRVFNPGSEPTTARVLGPVAVHRVRLDETCPLPCPSGALAIGPGEIATLRLTTASSDGHSTTG
jgi:alpha-mannosidase